jgi:CHAD domain-containing protein
MTTAASSELAAHLAQSLKASRRCIRRELGRVQRKASEKAVHDLRVELRKLAALLALIETVACKDTVQKAIHTLKKRLDDSSDLRDVQVQLDLLKPLWANFPEAGNLKKVLVRREEKLVSKLEHKVASAKFSGLKRRLKAIEKELKTARKRTEAGPNTELADEMARQSFETVKQLRGSITGESTDSIHRLRVAFKRFRYTCELLQPFLPSLTEKHVDRMKLYQSRAGAIQDADVLLTCLAKVVKHRKLSPANLRRLRSELIDRRRRAIEIFLSRIDDLFEFRRVFERAKRPKRRESE